jgi:hypothetical protein
VKWCTTLCLLVVSLAGCGGGEARDIAAPEAATTEAAPIVSTDSPATAPAPTSTGAEPALSSTQRHRIAAQADVADAAIQRWDRALDACIGPSGSGDDAGASCTRAAWDQLFDQMYAVQYELLAAMDRMRGGACREGLSRALDGVHGLLSGATPLKVVWLDEQQRPPMLFDLEAIVDIARPAGTYMRDALASACGR